MEKTRRYCLDVLRKKHIPLAPHIYFPQFLDDNRKTERELGIQCALELLKLCDEVYVYTNGKITSGMRRELRLARKMGKKIVYKKPLSA